MARTRSKSLEETYELKREKQLSELRNTFNLCVANGVYQQIMKMGEVWLTARHRLDRFFAEVIDSIAKEGVVQEWECRLKNIRIDISQEVVDSFRSNFIGEQFYGGKLQADWDWRRHIFHKTLHVIWLEDKYEKVRKQKH